MPVSDDARGRLKRFFAMDENVWPDLSRSEVEARLRTVSWFDFLREHGGLSEECLALYNTTSHGGEGFSAVNLSAAEAFATGLPGRHLLGEGRREPDHDYPMVMFPDGNASVARLMVSQLIPAASPEANFDNIALADFDYAALDREQSAVRLRLEATAVRVRNADGGVAVKYVQSGRVRSVSARHGILACYHSIIPHLCPELPVEQREAQRYQVKCPLLLTNVLLRDGEAVRRSGLSLVRCPGRMHARVMFWRGNTAGGYEQGAWDHEAGPLNVVFWGSIEEPPGDLTLKERLRASRAKMLDLTFEDYEREVRTVLDGVFGPFGLDVKRDVLAVTVNRWPHGYAYWYTDLWDPDFEDGQYPHEIARRPFGNIAIANADAAADAYTHAAIDQAWRAVSELPGA